MVITASDEARILARGLTAVHGAGAAKEARRLAAQSSVQSAAVLLLAAAILINPRWVTDPKSSFSREAARRGDGLAERDQEGIAPNFVRCRPDASPGWLSASSLIRAFTA